MDSGNAIVKKWLWLAYPGIVLLLIFVSWQWLVAGPEQIWQKIAVKQQKVAEQRLQAASLRQKLAVLREQNVNSLNSQLGFLELAAPTDNKISALLALSRQTAGSSVSINGYKGAGGGGLTLSLGVTDLTVLKDMLARLQETVPLLTIKSVKLTKSTQAEVGLEVAWKQSRAVEAVADKPLPTLTGVVEQLQQKLATYITPVVGVATTSGEVIKADPFSE